MYEKEDDSYDKVDDLQEDESMIDRKNNNRKNIPAKKQILKLEEYCSEIKSNIAENKKKGQILRSENMTLEHKSKESFNSAIKIIMEDLFNFEKEFKKMIENDKNETLHYKTEIHNLTMEKCNIEQTRLVLDSRLREAENDLGYDNN